MKQLQHSYIVCLLFLLVFVSFFYYKIVNSLLLLLFLLSQSLSHFFCIHLFIYNIFLLISFELFIFIFISMYVCKYGCACLSNQIYNVGSITWSYIYIYMEVQVCNDHILFICYFPMTFIVHVIIIHTYKKNIKQKKYK